MSYIFGGNTGISYSQLQKEREREKQLREMADAMQGRIGTPSTFGAGLTALGAGLAARNKRRKAGELEKSNNAAEAAGRERAQSAFQQLWGSRYGATPDSGSTGGTAAYRDAIASIESAGSGDYGAIGPTNPKLGRALGRYQIMEANIGPWSREALGREVTPDEFLKNPQIQDAIFDHKFNGYVEQFGPEGAAQAWFAGPGGVGKLDRKDVLGTTVADYTDKFRGALGTTSARQPQGTQVAGDGATVDQIMSFMASDAYNYATPEQKSALGMLLQQRMQANDPLRQQQLAMGEIELENARNPQVDPLDAIRLEQERIKLDQMRNPEPKERPTKQGADGYWYYADGEKERVFPDVVAPERTPLVENNFGSDKFDDAFAGNDADALSEISASGLAARRNLGRIDQLESLLSESGSGFGANARLMAGEFGINTDGLDDLQAARALINSLVPEQRQPGSGPMSDADLELFKQSLPRIINQPNGNQIIINTMRSIAQYDAEGAAIVQALRAGEINRAEAFDALQNRANPLEGFKPPQQNTQSNNTGPASMGVDYSQMSMSELVNNPPTTEAEAAEWNRRFDALQGGQ